jgi:outer membrane receptor protein involved in Fe transport
MGLTMRTPFKTKTICGAVKLALIGATFSLSPSLFAQENAPDAETEIDQSLIEFIEVTSRYRKETLNKIPISVTTFDAGDIEEAGLQNINDIAAATVGISLEKTFGRTADVPVIRGVSGIPGFGGQKASYFIDGVFFGGSIQSLPLDLIERVEIVKGPQSAQYGRRTFSGAINFITRKPSEELSGYVDLTLGQNGNRRLAAGASSEISDSVAFRASVSLDNYDGDWENTKLNGPEVGGEKTKSHMLGLYFTPTNDTDIAINYIYNDQEDEHQAFGFQGSDQNNCFLDARAYFCGQAQRKLPISIGGLLPNDQYGTSATNEHLSFRLNHHFDFGTLTWISGMNKRDTEAGFDQTYAGYEEVFSFGFFSGGPFFVPATIWHTFTESGSEETSHEVRFSSSALYDTLYWSVGAYRWNQEQEPSVIDAFAEELTNTAVMAMATYDVTDEFRVSGEIRRSTDEVNTEAYDRLIQNPQFSNVSNEFESTTTRFILEYDLDDETLLYATRSEGNSPGSFNTNAQLPPELVTVEEEEVVMYEAGVKSTLFDGSFYISAAIYTMDWTNQQFTDSFQPDDGVTVSYTATSGSTDISGFEIQGKWALSESFSIDFGLSQTDAEFNDLLDGNQCRFFKAGGGTCSADEIRQFGNVSGNTPPFIPENEAVLSFNYKTELADGIEGFARLDVNHDTSRYAHVHNQIETGDRTVANFRTGVQLENWRLTAWMNNITNDDTPTYVFRYIDAQSFALRSRAFPIAPARGREVGIRATYKF